MEAVAMNDMGALRQAFAGRRVFVTGHTGFKGAWLCLFLARLGARVSGYALAPATEPSLFDLAGVADTLDGHCLADVRDPAALAAAMQVARPELVLHLAAQALVRDSYADPASTWSTNVMGTVNLLEAVRACPSVRAALVVTTDKCYQNMHWPWGYRENDRLGGNDPYSASKAATELVTASYRDSFLAAQGIAVATARAGNVIGGGDWAQDRLLPDAVRAWEKGATLHIRRPQATRPWQHVLEPLAAYLRLAQRLWESPALAGAYNFGPLPHEAATVKNVIELASTAYPESATSYENESEGPHEAGWLALETAHARQVLGVAPHWSLNTAVARTMNWYRQQHGGADARALCLADIDAWEARP